MEQGTIERGRAPTRGRSSLREARRRVPRSRGAVCGCLLIILGIWAGLIPFIGPYFNYEFDSDQAWVISWDRVWLNVLPAVALFGGGLMLLVSRRRISGALGGWLALAGGIWFAIGPAVSLLWDATLGPAAPIGPPIGSTGVRVLEYVGFFYGVGAVGTALAAFALGRFSVVGVRDLEYASPSADAPTRAATAGGNGDGVHADTRGGEEEAVTPAASSPGRVRRLLRRG